MKLSKKKMTKDTIPERFTLPLVIVDFIPVFLFIFTILFFSKNIYFDYLIILGGFICFFSGIIKVLWKLIVVLEKKNVWWMFIQMRIVMPIGFLILIFGFIFGWKYFSYIIFNASFNSRIFFTFWIIGMSLMSIFAIILDSSDPKANWIEQIINSIAQCFLCLAVFFI